MFVGVYFISQIVPQSDDERFYLIQGSWSLLVLLFVASIYRTKTGLIICALELLHIVLNLSTCVDYLTNRSFIYPVYPIILQSINAIEAIVLIVGAPWIAISNRLKSLFGNTPFGGLFYRRDNSPLQTIRQNTVRVNRERENDTSPYGEVRREPGSNESGFE